MVVGSVVFILAGLTVYYEPSPHDVLRFDGHARNFGLLALLFALAFWLRDLRVRRLYIIGSLVLLLVTWPSSIEPIRTLALATGNGIDLANARSESDDRIPQATIDPSFLRIGRYAMPSPVSAPIATYIRTSTPLDSRILSPKWDVITAITGRPNASGFVRLAHITPATGPDYVDAISFLEPVALRRLGTTHIHATDSWLSRLPSRAHRWLSDPQLFELLVRGKSDSLYRVLPGFLQLDPPPAAQSFEALRRTIPASADVRVIGLTDVDSARIAEALAHTRLIGSFPRGDIHLRSEIISQLPHNVPSDFAIVARDRPGPFGIRTANLIWWNKAMVAYETRTSSIPAADPPPLPSAHFTVQVSELDRSDGRIYFSATFSDHSPTAWTGQDWLLVSGRDLPWALPTEDNGIAITSLAWFAGQIAPGGETTHVYEFDARQNQLTVQNRDGAFVAIQSSGDRLVPGLYVLAVRLRYNHLQAAIIPVMRIAIADSGLLDYTLYEGEHATQVLPCPERLQDTASCRRLAHES